MTLKHNEWSYIEFQGGEFRIRYFDYGFTYSEFNFQVKTYRSIRKWIFFGPFLSYWSEPISGAVIDNLLPVTSRKLEYSEGKVKSDFLKIANHYYDCIVPNIELESPEDDEEELEFISPYISPFTGRVYFLPTI